MARATARLLISGTVQGVFYRAFTQKTALSLGLTGWVRNLPDGRVEALVQGERDKVDTAISRCHDGPQGAQVTAVDVEWVEKPLEKFRTFEVRYF